MSALISGLLLLGLGAAGFRVGVFREKRDLVRPTFGPSDAIAGLCFMILGAWTLLEAWQR